MSAALGSLATYHTQLLHSCICTHRTASDPKPPLRCRYGGTAHTDPAVPANTEINYEITLVHLFRTHDTAFNLTAAIGRCRPGETFQYAHGGCTECAAGQFMATAGSGGRPMKSCYRCAKGKVSPPGARGCVSAGLDAYRRIQAGLGGHRPLWHAYRRVYGGICARHACEGNFSSGWDAAPLRSSLPGLIPIPTVFLVL